MNLSPVEAINRVNESVTVEMLVQRTKCCTGSRQGRGSRFLLCQLSQTDPDYLKYPPQHVVRCDGYEEKETSKEVIER